MIFCSVIKQFPTKTFVAFYRRVKRPAVSDEIRPTVKGVKQQTDENVHDSHALSF